MGSNLDQVRTDVYKQELTVAETTHLLIITTYKLYYHDNNNILCFYTYNNFNQNCTIDIKTKMCCKLCVAV